MNRKILIAGGSGMVGTALVKYFQEKGAIVWVLTTQKNPNKKNFVYWNPSLDIFPNFEQSFDAIINLSGANIGDKYWTQARKNELISSRLLSSKMIAECISQNRIKTKHFVQFSAIGYYGNSDDKWLDENSPKGKGFLADLTEMWENSSKISLENTLYTILRLGIVLDTQKGAFPKMTKSIEYGIKIIFGNGYNYLSTIQLDDIAPIVESILNDKKEGIINLVDNNPTTQIALLENYSKKLNKNPITLKIPSLVLKFFLGDFSQIMLDSQRVRSNKLINKFKQ